MFHRFSIEDACYHYGASLNGNTGKYFFNCYLREYLVFVQHAYEIRDILENCLESSTKTNEAVLETRVYCVNCVAIKK